MRVRARWQDTVLAETDRSIVVEGNHYFPADAVRWEHLRASDTVSVCPWKGKASYYDLEVDGQTVPDAAWQYRRPWPWARMVRDRVAFRGGVRVAPVPEAGHDRSTDGPPDAA